MLWKKQKGKIADKFPLLKNQYRSFLLSSPKITKALTLNDLKNSYQIIQTEDTPILAASIKAKVDFLITLDKRFQKLAMQKIMNTPYKIEIVSPGEFLHEYRKAESN